MNKETKLQGLLAICVFLFIGLGLALARPGLPDYAPYLSFSPDTDGVKGIRLLFERGGAAVKEWRLPPERLPDGGGDQLYIAVEPQGTAKESGDALLQWAEAGNEVIVFGEAGIPLLEELSPLYVDPGLADGIVYAVSRDGVETAAAATVTGEQRLKIAGGAAGTETLLRDEAGVLAVRKEVGAGSVTVSLTGEWLTNGNILTADHFELSWRLLNGADAAGRTVYFDEYHHGYSVSPGIAQVYPEWLLAALLQVALAGAAWLWQRGKRFGPAYTPRVFRVRRGDETLLAVAGWYNRGGLAAEALGHSVAHLRHLLQAGADGGAAQLLAAAERALEGRGKPPAALGDVLERWERLRASTARGERPAYGGNRWLADAAVLEETFKLLEEAR